MSEEIIEVTDSSFEETVLKAEKPVMVDFWAAWCGPCKAITPVVEEIAKEFADKVIIGKCNVDENPTTPTKYGIQAIPTLIFFKGGQEAERITGMVPKSRIEEVFNNLIAD